jgi:cadmium resistance protein CadD (predicted permease)
MELLLTSALAFAATNIDDLFLLALFFSNKTNKTVTIVTGQLTGIGTLIAISVVGAAVGNFVSPPIIGLLGLFPIYLGIKQFSRQDHESNKGLTQNSNGVFGIAMVTIANGGDNIGVYIPLFVALTVFEKIVMAIIFFVLTLLWCATAKYLSNHPLLKAAFDKYGHIATPIVLILLGIYVLYENRTLSLLF